MYIIFIYKQFIIYVLLKTVSHLIYAQHAPNDNSEPVSGPPWATLTGRGGAWCVLGEKVQLDASVCRPSRKVTHLTKGPS